MFNGFTKETGDFLWELAFNNERPWFNAHKEQFERCLKQPFQALAEDTLALMRRRFPERAWRLHVSRIYRDARRLFGRGPYKDHLWFSLRCGDAAAPGLDLWFEIGAARYAWGAGAFDMSPALMETFRRCVEANPSRFERLVLAVQERGRFTLQGEAYKRPKGSLSPVIDPWYNRKWVGLERQEDFGGELFSPRLPELLAEDFSALMPLNEFFMEVFRAAGPDPAPRR